MLSIHATGHTVSLMTRATDLELEFVFRTSPLLGFAIAGNTCSFVFERERVLGVMLWKKSSHNQSCASCLIETPAEVGPADQSQPSRLSPRLCTDPEHCPLLMMICIEKRRTSTFEHSPLGAV
jgi:hypothetical protein